MAGTRTNPIVTPPAVTTYITAMIPRSRQLTNSFHRKPTATITPTNGMITPARLNAFSAVVIGVS